MNIAVLILLHEYSEQQRRLVRHLSRDFDVFVHIDRKSPVRVEDVAGGRVSAFKEHKVYWGGFSQILATLLLLEKSYERGGV